MEDVKDILPFHAVPKLEPPDGEFVLCGEFVDSVPPAHPALPPIKVDNEDPIAEKITRENPLKLKDLKIILNDCLQEIIAIKTDVKDEPEETIYDDSLEPELDDDPSVEEQTTQHQLNNVSTNEIERVQENMLPLTRKIKKEVSYNDESPSLSGSDGDKSYSPKRRFRDSAQSRKKKSTFKKGKSNKGKKLPLNTDMDTSKLISDTLSELRRSIKTPQSNSFSLLKTASSPAQRMKRSTETQPRNSLILPKVYGSSCAQKKNDSGDDEAMVHGILWSCCNMQFEEFSSFNKHKVQKHFIEELKCSFCTEKLFSSFDEIEKHYLDIHADSTWTTFHCLDCRLVFGVKSSFLKHKAKCGESQVVGSGILDLMLDNAVTRKEVKVNENTAFRLSCCENIIGNFEDFVIHKFSDHNIPRLTCGLCSCVKDSEVQLRTHYKKFHFSKFWQRMELEKHSNTEEGTASPLTASPKKNNVLSSVGEGDIAQISPEECTAMQDGVLCQCLTCSMHMNQLILPSNYSDEVNQNVNCFRSVRSFYCKSCNKRFLSERYLINHNKTHSGVKPFPCDICGSAFTRETSLKIHMLYKHSANPFKIECSICKKVFVNKNSLDKHIRNVHFKMNKNISLKCKYCEKTFSQKKNLERHSHQFHLKKEEFICGDCNSIFYDKQYLVEHIKRCHLPRETYSCSICGHLFLTKLSLKVHMTCKHSTSEYYCEVCGKMFKTKERVDKHMATHSDEKPFICQTCGKGFKRDVNLQQHQYTHSDSRPHLCNICGQTFRLRTHVKQHMAVHGVIKNHKCFVCDVTFSRKTELNSHLVTHGV